MAKAKHSESEEGAAPKPKGGGVGIAGWIMLALLVPGGIMTTNCARAWSQVAAEERALAQERAQHAEIIARLQPFAYVLEQKSDKYQICNRTADTITVNWLAAAYTEGDQIKMFDSAHCKDWKPVVLPIGENKFINLSSAQEGCNWNGNVMYFAIAYTRESTENTTYFEDVEMFRGFERQCYNIQ
ncbi:MAG TPA: hypothetical protein VF310_05815 [Vicinamibacteria bacterium]